MTKASHTETDDAFAMGRVNPRRSLILLAFGALTGLAIAGFGLFTAKGTATHTVPPEDVALVNQRPLLTVDFVAQLEQVYGVSLAQATKAQRDKILSDMIREELFVQRGLELDFPSSDPDVRTALVAAVEQQVLADIAADLPTDAQLQAYYEQHKDKYSSDGIMIVHDLVLASGVGRSSDEATKLAQAAADAIRSGGSVADVAAKYGLKDSGKTNGEEFYFAAQIHLGDRLYAAAKALKAGQASPPIADADGLHVLAMEKNTTPVPLAFAAAREHVLNDFRREAQIRVQQADEKYLRSKAEILIAPEYR